jgi:hypothetical protein
VESTCGQASVSTGVAFRDTGKPIVQISTPRAGGTSLNDVNGCPVDFYVDGDALEIGSTNLTSSNIDVIVESNRVQIKVCICFATQCLKETHSHSLSRIFSFSTLIHT